MLASVYCSSTTTPTSAAAAAMSSSYSSDDAAPSANHHHHHHHHNHNQQQQQQQRLHPAKKGPQRPAPSALKASKHAHARKAPKKHDVGQVRILKRGEHEHGEHGQGQADDEDDEDDAYTDTGDSKDEEPGAQDANALPSAKRKTTRRKKNKKTKATTTEATTKDQRPPVEAQSHPPKNKKKAAATAAAAPTHTATASPVVSRASSDSRRDDEAHGKKKKHKKAELVRTHSDRAAPAAPLLPKALSLALLNPPARTDAPTAVKVYGLPPSSKLAAPLSTTVPVTIRARVANGATPSSSSLSNSPRKASPGGGEYAGPTFSNSPAPSALPKPAFTTQKTSPPAQSLEPRASKKSGLADAAFWMEGGILSGNNTTANVTPTESPGSRSGGVTPTMYATMAIAPIPVHRDQPYTDELHVGNPNGPHTRRQLWPQPHDDGGSGSMLLGLLRGDARHEEDLDVWSQGLKSLLKMS